MQDSNGPKFQTSLKRMRGTIRNLRKTVGLSKQEALFIGCNFEGKR